MQSPSVQLTPTILLSLPKDILIQTLQNFSSVDILELAQVNKDFYKRIADSRDVLEFLWRRDLGRTPPRSLTVTELRSRYLYNYGLERVQHLTKNVWPLCGDPNLLDNVIAGDADSLFAIYVFIVHSDCILTLQWLINRGFQPEAAHLDTAANTGAWRVVEFLIKNYRLDTQVLVSTRRLVPIYATLNLLKLGILVLSIDFSQSSVSKMNELIDQLTPQQIGQNLTAILTAPVESILYALNKYTGPIAISTDQQVREPQGQWISLVDLLLYKHPHRISVEDKNQLLKKLARKGRVDTISTLISLGAVPDEASLTIAVTRKHDIFNAVLASRTWPPDVLNRVLAVAKVRGRRRCASRLEVLGAHSDLALRIKASKKRICTGTTTRGYTCKRKALVASEYCTIHQL